MSAVWLCQCLCPERHCILAAAGEAETLAEAQMTVRAPLASNVARLELGRTRYATMADATPELSKQEVANRVANIVFGDLHKGTKH